MTMSGQDQGSQRQRRPARPLDRVRLNDLALAYVARFATTAARLERYLARKLRERGWEGEGEPDLNALTARFAELGYIDDAAWASAKGGDLLRRGYGARRIGQALSEAGVAEPIRAALAPGVAAQRQAAVDLARRKRFGPFSRDPAPAPALGPAPADRGDPARRDKQLAALVRAGHGFDIARRVVEAATAAELDEWVDDARQEEQE